MEKIIRYFNLFLLVSFFLISCNKDVLELDPLSAYSDASVWKDPALVETFVNGIYFKMEIPNGDQKYGLPNLVDELHRRDGGNQLNFNNCKITADLIPGWGTDLPSWNNLYVNIRACNLFLKNIDNVPDDGKLTDNVTKKDRMTGEIYFLRAWFYMRLTSLYGGVPIIDKVYGLDDDFKVARNTYEECVKFIVSDCDKAASLLPLVNSTDKKSRATKGAALALKSRILIYAASDLHNTTVFPGYSNPELIGYTDANRTARYQAAKDAAKAVMNLGLYSLYKAEPARTDSIAQNYVDLFNSKDCVEDILVRYATSTSYNVQYSWQELSGPNGYHCKGSNAPTDNLVRDFERKDGTKFDWNNPVHAAAPYKYRDPRFYATILYEGAKWRTRSSGEFSIDPVGVIQVGSWQKWNSTTNSMQVVWGLDTRKGPNSPGEGSYTGYYIRKYFDIAVDAQFFVPDIGWRYFRYAEVLLNYAEACIGLGQDEEARSYINMIRKRAGMPNVTESGTALQNRYRNERRIEMAVEEQRFYDVRRWVIGSQAYVAAYKVDVVYKMDPVTHVTATVPTITPAVHNTYSWNDKAYFLPIMNDEINKNSMLVQNPGY
jgi:hypothetical protein